MQRRKDNKGRVLKDGEVYRKSDGLYMYRWTAKNGKRHTIYDVTLEGLREKEEKIQGQAALRDADALCQVVLDLLFLFAQPLQGCIIDGMRFPFFAVQRFIYSPSLLR